MPKQNQLSFQARCPQIKIAQDASHIVNTELYCLSSTKFAPKVNSLVEQNYDFIHKFTNQNKQNQRCMLLSASPEQIKLIRILLSRRNLVDKINACRGAYQSSLMNTLRYTWDILTQLSTRHIGNCGEIAYATDIVLKFKGIKNISQARLTVNNKPIDHAFCVFNKDGSPFSKINRNTIIVDPWQGTAEFATVALKDYKASLKQLFKIPDNAKLGIVRCKPIDLSQEEIDFLAKSFPNLVKH